jgi:putative ABC transport system substrate-binding protein
MGARTSVAFVLLFAVTAAVAQPAEKTWRLAVLVADRPGRVETMLEGPAGMGYLQDKNLIVTRVGFKSIDELPARASEIVHQKPDVIVVGHGTAALAVKSLTKTIPIVMASSNDAVEQRIVESLARPGGNVTGLTNIAPEVTGKRIEILKEAVPKAKRIAVLGCPEAGSGSKAEWLASQSAMQRVGLEPVPAFFRLPDELAPAFANALRQKVDAVLVLECSFYPPFRDVAPMINQSRLTAMYSGIAWPEAGGLMAYAPDGAEQWRQAAVYVDKILKGAKPADLPIQIPRFEFAINRKAATALKPPLPQSVLQRATRFID